MASISPDVKLPGGRDFSSPSMATAAASVGASRLSKNPVTPQRDEGEAIKFNESLKQYINRIYGSSVNPYLEANIN